MDYNDLDPFDVFMSALALALVSGLDEETIWISCNISESSEDFDVAIAAACDLKVLVENHCKEKRR
jgi:hypothetical protein